MGHAKVGGCSSAGGVQLAPQRIRTLKLDFNVWFAVACADDLEGPVREVALHARVLKLAASRKAVKTLALAMQAVYGRAASSAVAPPDETLSIKDSVARVQRDLMSVSGGRNDGQKHFRSRQKTGDRSASHGRGDNLGELL